jgi:hypothetical protein
MICTILGDSYNFNLNLMNYNESEEDIINIFYNELEKNVSSLN